MSRRHFSGLAVAALVLTLGAATAHAQVKLAIAGPMTGPNAAFGEQLRAVRSRTPYLDAQDPKSRKRLHATGFRLSHCLAMITRWISFVPSPITVSGASR